MTECSYCGEPSEIVKHHSSEKCHSICKPCLDRVEAWPALRLLERGHTVYIRTVFHLAQTFLKKEPIPNLSKAQLESVRNTPSDMYRRFESLAESPAFEWMPVKLEPNKEYEIWINSEKFKNFKDQAGNSSSPFRLVFKTK